MRNTQNVLDFLASDEVEKAQIARFDAMYENATDAARLTVDSQIQALKSVKYMGTHGAKFLYMRLYDYFNMTEAEQEAARKHGVQLLSIQ